MCDQIKGLEFTLENVKREEDKAVRRYCHLLKTKGKEDPETIKAEIKVECNIKQLFKIQSILDSLKKEHQNK